MKLRAFVIPIFSMWLVLFACGTSSRSEASGSTKGIIDFQRPPDALQLVGEKESLLIPESHHKGEWTFHDGILTASPRWDSVVTPEAYHDFRMHVEFNINDAGNVPRERSGNSGIYIQQRYELQILNSHGISPADYKLDDCGCLYGAKKPDKFVCKPPGEWQSFDIAFRAARYEGDRKTENARITVYQNGELIHDDVVLNRKTGAGRPEENSCRPIMLQGHHNQVQYRNIWIQKLSLSDNESANTLPQVTASQKKLPLSGEAFKLNGSDAFVILPRGPRDQNAKTPWVWYAPTLPPYPAKEETWMFERFLKSGIAVAGIDVGESYGSPNGTKKYHEFYKYLVQTRGMRDRPCLLARSRGGLMLYSWAIEHPESTSGIAGIYPVCNLASYPGLDRACSAFELTAQELQTRLAQYNPIDRLAPLAQAKVPLFHIHGDQDTLVPLNDNSLVLADRYRALGGPIDLEVVAGQGHNMWEGWFQSERLVAFVCRQLGRPVFQHPVPESDLWLTYPGKDGPGKGKHIVLIAAEQEYRSEQSMPMLARILSQNHGFDCTVLFSVNEQGDVDPTLPAPFDDKTKRHNIPGLEHLAKADCLIWISRFMQLPDEQMQHWYEYFDSGKPIIALRTANHGFYGGSHYLKNGKAVSLNHMLGGTFMSHHGGWHSEATRGLIVPEAKSHPILTGVDDIWGTSDVYRCHNDKSPFPSDCQALVLGQPLRGLTPDSEPNKDKEPLPIAWTKTWIGNQELPSKIFHFTMGSAEDFANAGVRRITINAVYWGLGMEDSLRADSSVDIVGEYRPLKPGFNYKELGVQPHKPAHYK
jgi:predicted esterase